MRMHACLNTHRHWRCRSMADQTPPNKAAVRDAFQAAKCWISAQKRQLCRVAASSKLLLEPLCAYPKGAPSPKSRPFLKPRRNRCTHACVHAHEHLSAQWQNPRTTRCSRNKNKPLRGRACDDDKVVVSSIWPSTCPYLQRLLQIPRGQPGRRHRVQTCPPSNDKGKDVRSTRPDPANSTSCEPHACGWARSTSCCM
jgi:hypothetical protein